MNQNLMGSTYGRFCIKVPHSRMKGLATQAQPTEPLVYSASSLKQQSRQTCRPTWTHHDSEPTSLCSVSLMLHVFVEKQQMPIFLSSF
jgi:hypothetical protein